MNMKDAMEHIDRKIIAEAAEKKKLSAKGIVAGILAVALLLAAIPAASNTSSALLKAVEKQAELVITEAESLDDYSDGEESLAAEIESFELQLTVLEAETEAEVNHLTPAADALEKYKDELASLKERARNTAAEFKAVAKEYRGSGDRRLTAEQRKALRETKKTARNKLKQLKKAKKVITAKQIAQARRANDTQKLNELYGEICLSIEKGMANLNSVLDKIDVTTEKISDSLSTNPPDDYSTYVDSMPRFTNESKEGVASLVSDFNENLTEEYLGYRIFENDWYNVTPTAVKNYSDYEIYATVSLDNFSVRDIIVRKGEKFLYLDTRYTENPFVCNNVTYAGSIRLCVAFLHCDYNLDGETDLLISVYSTFSGRVDTPSVLYLNGATFETEQVTYRMSTGEEAPYTWTGPRLYLVGVTEEDISRGVAAHVCCSVPVYESGTDVITAVTTVKVGEIIYENGKLICCFNENSSVTVMTLQ